MSSRAAPLLAGVAAVLLLACSDDDDFVSDAARARAQANALIDALAVDGAAVVPAPAVVPDGPRVERLCGPETLAPGETYLWEVVVDDPAVDRLVMGIDFATRAIEVPIAPDADGRAVFETELAPADILPADAFVRVWAVVDGGATAAAPARIRIGEGPSARNCAYVTGQQPATAVAFGGPDDHLLAVGTLDGRVQWWDLDTGHRLADIAAHTGPVRAVGIAPDGTRLASGTAAGQVQPWLPDGTPDGDPMTSHAGPVTALEIDRVGQRVASASWDGTVVLIDPLTGETVRLEVGDRINDLAFSPDGQFLAAATGLLAHEGRLVVWRLGEGASAELFAERDLKGQGTAVGFDAAGASLLVAHGRGDVDLITADSEVRSVVGAPDDLIAGLLIIPGFQQALLVSYDGRIAVADLASGEVTQTYRSPILIEAVAISPSARFVAAALVDGAVRVNDLADLPGRMLTGGP